MTRELEHSYFDNLCEQEQLLQENFKEVRAVLDLLDELATVGSSETRQLDALKLLSEEYEALFHSSVNLRFVKYKAREAQVTLSKRGKRNDLNTRLRSMEGLSEYVTLYESISRDSLEYINLLGRLSVDLAKQIEIGDPSVTEFVVDDWKPPKGMYAILEELGDPSIDATDLGLRLGGYLDRIKMERAKYAIQNKYSLQETLEELTQEVNTWRKEWDTMENLMFGDGSNSLKKMLQNVDLLKARIEKERKDKSEMQVND